MAYRTLLFWVVLLAGSLSVSLSLWAASPETVHIGKVLFEKQWIPGISPSGGDGLGPVFNDVSCVACHRQGGVGGGGPNQNNVVVIGLAGLNAGVAVRPDVVLGQLHPDLAQGGAMLAARSTHPEYRGYFEKFFRQSIGFNGIIGVGVAGQDTEKPGEEGNLDARRFFGAPEEIARKPGIATAFHANVGRQHLAADLRISARSTPALFGAGLIEQVSDRLLMDVARSQLPHPEISGRPAPLESHFGKFGYRSSVATLREFVEQACALELGLQTPRVEQAKHPLNVGYRSPGIDLTEMQVQSMVDYVASLPAPQRRPPDNKAEEAKIRLGMSAFEKVGCAVCHRENMPPAMGIYSDLLLHDMGYELSDYVPAPPEIKRIYSKLASVLSDRDSTTTEITVTEQFRQYYGGVVMPGNYSSSSSSIKTYGNQGAVQIYEQNYTEPYSYEYPPRFIVTKSAYLHPMKIGERSEQQVIDWNQGNLGPSQPVTTQIDRKTERFVEGQVFEVRETVPTRYRNEWRTAPLWGLRDSAPYMHDGRAATVLEAIAMHDGEAAGSRARFFALSLPERNALLTFLDTLVAPTPSPLTTLAQH